MVVADKISASKKIGIVPRTTSTHIANRPKLMLSPSFKSTAANLENEENVSNNACCFRKQSETTQHNSNKF